jgi:hypothetical protein
MVFAASDGITTVWYEARRDLRAAKAFEATA